jgi:hypothetical protein
MERIQRDGVTGCARMYVLLGRQKRVTWVKIPFGLRFQGSAKGISQWQEHWYVIGTARWFGEKEDIRLESHPTEPSKQTQRYPSQPQVAWRNIHRQHQRNGKHMKKTRYAELTSLL